MPFFGGRKRISVVAKSVRAMLTALVAPSREESGSKEYLLLEDKKNAGVFYTLRGVGE